MNSGTLIQMLAVAALPLLFAITVHEVAHGWAALKLGDKTALMMGRLTLNPVKHIDPIGTLLVPGVLLMLGGFLFGWAKPVPVTAENLRNPRRDMAWVALAGPMANLVMALGWALVAKIALSMPADMRSIAEPLYHMGRFGIQINFILMVLNLLPLPPLDGGRIVSSLLPGPLSWKFDKLENYGFMILLGLLATGVLGKVLLPVVGTLQSWLYLLVGL